MPKGTGKTTTALLVGTSLATATAAYALRASGAPSQAAEAARAATGGWPRDGDVPRGLQRRGDSWLRRALKCSAPLAKVDPDWGLPAGKAALAEGVAALRSDAIVYLLLAERNGGNLMRDGVSIGEWEETVEQIERDLPRTYPEIKHFADDDGRARKALRKVLRALAIAYPQTGYVQGMNFVAANVMLHMGGHEDKTFLLLRYMMEAPKYRLIHVFKPGLPNLRRFTELLEDLMKMRYPKLHSHFDSVGLEPLFYAQNWIMTLFSYMVPFEPLADIWDRFFEHGWTTIFQHCLAFFEVNLGALERSDFEACARILKKTSEDPPRDLTRVADRIHFSAEEKARIDAAVEEDSPFFASPKSASTSSFRTEIECESGKFTITTDAVSPAPTIMSTDSGGFFDALVRRKSLQGPVIVPAAELAYGKQPSPQK